MTAEQDAVTEQQIAGIVAANWVSFQTIRDLMAKLDEMAWKGERVEDDQVIIACPRCGVEQADFDGFGVVNCEACGYCTHPSAYGGVCEICGAVVEPVVVEGTVFDVVSVV
jgi:methionyl-tRNA synthetase